MHAPDRVQLSRQFAWIGGHDRARASVDKRSGDRERRALVAADREGGDDLKDRAACERGVGPASKRVKRIDVHAQIRRQEGSIAEKARLTAAARSAKPPMSSASRAPLVGARPVGRII
jgi:hypothetical protein